MEIRRDQQKRRKAFQGKQIWAIVASVSLLMEAVLDVSAAQPPTGGNGDYATITQEESQENGNGFFSDYYGPSQEDGGGVTYLPNDYDMNYSGPLDAMGREMEGMESGENSVTGEPGEVIMITDELGYDPQQQMYVNYVRGNKDKRYYSSIPPRMITNGSVSFQMGNRSQYNLYCNGEQVSNDLSNLSAEGAYVLESFEQGGVDAERFEFTILQSCTNALEEFTIPEGFRFTGISVNGAYAAVPRGTAYSMPSDGKYAFEFGCDEIGLFYHVDVRKDTVAPRLEISGLVDGVARGPVSMSVAAQEDTSIQVIKDGQEINTPYDLTLEDYGDYRVIISDRAGNSSEYSFTIQMYFTMTSLLVFLLLLLIAAGLLGYYRYVKTHLRIR